MEKTEMENNPTLIACKPLHSEYEKLKKISISSQKFSLGRSLSNSVVIPFLAISRNHCAIKKTNDGWILEDQSAFGVEVNGHRVGKGKSRKLNHDDIITLEPSREFVYKFFHPNDDEIPRKRIKIENMECDDDDTELINNVRLKFEESQNYEIKHIETKIQSAKQIQTASMMLKEQLQLEMDKKMQKLEADFAGQIENLQGEKNEVERQKLLLLEERDAQLNSVRQEMEDKIQDLQEQIRKTRETESELMNQNQELKQSLEKEREEFLAELSRESSSKHDMMEKLEAKIREQEEIRIKERRELEEMLRNETEQLRLAKEKELKELEEQKKVRELELTSELDSIKRSLAERVEESEQQRLMVEQRLNEQVEQMRKLSDEEKAKMEQILQERQEIEQKLAEAQSNAKNAVSELQEKIQQRETELAALAAERIQFQADQSSEVIMALQAQLEKVQAQLQNAETEKNTLIECLELDPGEGTSKQGDKIEAVGQIMESELQCSICAELFIESTTLNCSHTFCKYCIAMWKKKKKDCPICRAPIKSECRSLVLDTFIEKMAETLSDETKKKREELLKAREELVAGQQPRPRHATQARRGGESSSSSSSSPSSDSNETSDSEGGRPDEDVYPTDDEYNGHYGRYGYSSDDRYGYDSDDRYGYDSDEVYGYFRRSDDDGSMADDADSGSDGEPGGGAVPGADNAAGDEGRANHRAERRDGSGSRRRRAGDGEELPQRGRHVEGLPGSYYGGYGHCYHCGASGHWAPGCPYR